MGVRQRTDAQNRSLHQWCEELATECQAHGVTVKAIVEKIHVQVSSDFVKSVVRSIGEAKYQVMSTRDLTTIQLTDCVEEAARIFAEEGAECNFPSFNTQEFINYYSKNT